jgi:hypothetical protein
VRVPTAARPRIQAELGRAGVVKVAVGHHAVTRSALEACQGDPIIGLAVQLVQVPHNHSVDLAFTDRGEHAPVVGRSLPL